MNHLQRKTGQFLSESFSGDVLHPILSSPTDTLQALDEAFDAAKVVILFVTIEDLNFFCFRMIQDSGLLV